ncbi:MAG: hypothetical protein ABSE49_30015 [Polyangiaceae bacterium]
MAKESHFRSSMITDAQKASTAMQTSSIAKQLKSNGFTSATMAKAASDLTDLHAKAEAARSAWLQASAALQTEAQAFDQTWSSYCNIVRGITPDTTVRKAHGVPSPGQRKGPSFKRGPRKAATTATTAPAVTPAKPQ